MFNLGTQSLEHTLNSSTKTIEISEMTIGNDTSLADLPSVFSSESDKKTPPMGPTPPSAGGGLIQVAHLDQVKAKLKKSGSGETADTTSTALKAELEIVFRMPQKFYLDF